eukprot:TRINITY_DN2391_c0_g2_i2.p4 TRINITY_DN2391_c0_g2~~TRINITY_DN2391_c0_g2_i2.p4  ORF type:complete len:103 (+),score=3.15 TRINITY_DN2391_c0_g2_i2:499-807(+)
MLAHGGGGLPGVADLAGGRGWVRPRLEVRRGAASFLADCGVPFFANLALRSDTQRWDLLFARVAQPVVAVAVTAAPAPSSASTVALDPARAASCSAGSGPFC